MTEKRGLLENWGRWAAGNPVKVFIIAGLITAILTFGVLTLRMEMTFYSILPESSNQVKDLQYITDEFPYSSSIIAVVDARNYNGPDAKQKVIDTINQVDTALSGDAFSQYVDASYGSIDSSYLKQHGFMLSKTSDLSRLEDMYRNTDLTAFLRAVNNDLEREYSGNQNALEDDETQVVAWVHGLENILSLMNNDLDGNSPDSDSINSALDSYLVGDNYYLSKDEKMGLLFVLPTYTVNDLGPLVDGTNAIESEVKKIAAQNGLDAGITGFITVGRDEMVTSEKGFGEGMLVALILIITLLILVFRLRSTPIIIGLPLMIGIYWTMGLTGFLVHRLNIMTAMYMVALVGLGVDYAIHMLSGFVQERDSGLEFIDAIGSAFRKSGRGIITGALTTAAAFIVLLVAESGMVRELAVVASTGIIAELAAMLLLVPAMIGARSLRYQKKGVPDPMMNRRRRISSSFGDKIGRVSTRYPWGFLIGLGAAAVILAFWAPKVSVQDNIMKMEAKGLESIKLQDVMVDEFGLAPDSLFVLSDDINAIPDMVDKLKELASVKYVDAVTNYVPTEDQQDRRRPYLLDIQHNVENDNPHAPVDQSALLDELYRLETNLIEMGDLSVLGGSQRLAYALNQATGLDNDGKKVAASVFDKLYDKLESGSSYETRLSDFQKSFSPVLARRVMQMANPANITPDMAPDMVKATFYSRDGKQTLITISPTQNPWVGEFRSIFTKQVYSVAPNATSMILAADEMTRIAEVDGVRALFASLIVVFIILLIDFRNLKLTIISFLPLGMSFMSLLGIMAITGIQFDFVNIIAIPLLVGIGIDDTVHINHRYILEGKGGMRTTLAGTGTAVLMTTLTTIIGFASFIPSIMRTMRSTGIVLTVALALAYIFSVLFHPSVLIVIAEKFGWNIKPWGARRGSETTEE